MRLQQSNSPAQPYGSDVPKAMVKIRGFKVKNAPSRKALATKKIKKDRKILPESTGDAGVDSLILQSAKSLALTQTKMPVKATKVSRSAVRKKQKAKVSGARKKQRRKGIN